MKIVRKSPGEKLPEATLKKIHSQKFREKMPKRCFLLPSERKFPICTMQGGEWKIDPRLVKAAIVRAKQHGYAAIAKKAEALMRKIKKLQEGGKK